MDVLSLRVEKLTEDLVFDKEIVEKLETFGFVVKKSTDPNFSWEATAQLNGKEVLIKFRNDKKGNLPFEDPGKIKSKIEYWVYLDGVLFDQHSEGELFDFYDAVDLVVKRTNK